MAKKRGEIPEDATRSIHEFCADYTIYSYYTAERFEIIIKTIKNMGPKTFKSLIKKLAEANDALSAFSHMPDCDNKKELADPFDEFGQCKCHKAKTLHWSRALAAYQTHPDYEFFPDDAKDAVSTFWQICTTKKLVDVDIFENISDDDDQEKFLRLIYTLLSATQNVNDVWERINFLTDFLKRYTEIFRKKNPDGAVIYNNALELFHKYNKAIWEIRDVIIKIAASINIDCDEWYIQ